MLCAAIYSSNFKNVAFPPNLQHYFLCTYPTAISIMILEILIEIFVAILCDALLLA